MSRMFTALDRITRQYHRYGRPIDLVLRPGLSESESTPCLQALPGEFSQEVRQLYQWHNGSCEADEFDDVFPGFRFLPLDMAVHKAQQVMGLIENRMRLTANAPWAPPWLPVFDEALSGYAFYAVPSQSKRHEASPVYYVRCDEDPIAYMAFDSLTHMLDTIATCYETDIYHVVEGEYEPCLIDDPRRVATMTRELNPQCTAWWLEQVPGARTVEDLATFLDQPGSVATEALGILLHPASVPSLIRVLQSDHLLAKLQAVRLLGRIGDARGIPALTPLLHDLQPQIPDAVTEALCEFDDTRAVAPLIEALQIGLERGNMRMANRAISRLGALGDFQALEPLLQALGQDETSRLAISALCRLRTETIVPILIDMLQSAPDTQAYAAPYLGAMGDARATEPLADLLASDEAEIRYYAALALADLGDPRGVTTLIKALHHALNRQIDASSVPPSQAYGRQHRQERDERKIRGMIQALGHLGQVRASAVLQRALREGPDTARKDAIRALGEIRAAEAIPLLLDVLKSTYAPERAKAAEALGRVGDARAVPGLINTLDDPYPSVRVQAIHAVACCGTLAILDVLEPLESDVYDPVSQAAHTARQRLMRSDDAHERLL